jgi:hypothetical protein
MSWAADQRQAWIAETLARKGQINRSDLRQQFQISTPQASLDFQRFLREHPGAMEYDRRRKTYLRHADPA